MRFNVFISLRGAAGTVEVPSRDNPIECANLASLLVRLADSLPNSGFVQTVGIRVESVPEPEPHP